MAELFSRVVLLMNKSSHVIDLKESRQFAPPGIYSYTIQLHSLHDKEIGATFFHQRTQEAARPTVIKIFVDGIECFNKILTPQVFIEYFRISFWVDEDGELTVRGVRATQTDQLRRIRLVGSLIRAWRFLIGRDDHRDQEGDIIA